MHLIHSTSVKGEDLDNLCWRLVKSQGFEVHGYYHSLSPATGMSIPWKLVWQSWSAALGIVYRKFTKEKYYFLRMVLYVQTEWGVGGSFASSLSHSLWVMGNGVDFVWSYMGYATERVLELLAAWQGTFGRHRNRAFWRVVPHCIMWCLWHELNAWCFEGSEWTILRLNLSFFTLYWIGVLP